MPKTFHPNVGDNQDYPLFVGSSFVSESKPATKHPVGRSTVTTVVTLQVTADSTSSPQSTEAISTSEKPKVENNKTEEPGSNMVIVRDQVTTTAATIGEKSTFSNPKVEYTTKNTTDRQRKITFSQLMNEFDWISYNAASVNKNLTQRKIYTEKLVSELSYFLALPPIVPINPNCTPLPLPPPEEISCSNYPTGFIGIRNNGTIKIGVLIQFGFDVDSLEVYLNEVYDVVDQFFIIESTKAHQKTLPKPLMWEEVKHQERFIKFAPKLTHFIIDDAQNADVWVKTNADPYSIWLMESLQERLRWEKFLEWNKAWNFFSADDIIGFGDGDEVPARRMVNMLKYCKLKFGYLDIGIWFPYGNINRAFRTDWPVSGYPYTLGDPTYWTLQTALEVYKSKGQIPSRMRGKAPGFLLGGMHMTHYGYLPFQIVKRITATEGGPFSIDEATRFSKLTVEGVKVMEDRHAEAVMNIGRTVALTTISKAMKDIAVLPWFYDCNRDRYPAWEGRHDSRLS